LFANAGILERAPLGQITEDSVDRLVAVNVKGTIFTVQKALPVLSDGAAIILHSSAVAFKGLGNNSVYAATKAAVRSFARNWISDLKQRKIRVNVVSPGAIETPGVMRAFPDEVVVRTFLAALASQTRSAVSGLPTRLPTSLRSLLQTRQARSMVRISKPMVDGRKSDRRCEGWISHFEPACLSAVAMPPATPDVSAK
jgi:NAD(P)-dependent dehydrogenase (short-subunit alcohol dehydrogenase family)